MRVSIYDLDRTLTRQSTYLRFLVFAARRSAAWRLLRLPEVLAAMAAYKLKILDRARLKEIMQDRLLGPSVRRDRVGPLADAFAQEVVERGCRPEVIARLEAERAQGCVIVIATAAFRLHAGPIAHRLGVEHLVATDAQRRGDRILARLDGPDRRGGAKMDGVDAWLREHEALAAAGFRFYSDDDSDMPVFERAAQCIAVHPGRRLRRIAEARGWEVIG
ncbi:MAG: HAD-IB family phosphatase [Caulobacteraceae bacterium]|nr:HAD-IB family phosphatase [Caulobacter sp.]